MRLAEALLRVPDAETAIALTADQLGRADFDGATADSAARAAVAAAAIALSKQLPARRRRTADGGLFARLGARTVVAATRARGAAARAPVRAGRRPSARRCDEAAQRAPARSRNLRFSLRHAGRRRAHRRATRSATWRSYAAGDRARSPPRPTRRGRSQRNDGISIKLSALHPRYEDAQRERVLRRAGAARVAAVRAGRARPTSTSPSTPRRSTGSSSRSTCSRRWPRASPRTIRSGTASASRCRRTRRARCELVERRRGRSRAAHGMRFMCRLVKGAYWDARDQARAGAGAAALPGLHAQAPHRHLATSPARARCWQRPT